MQSVEASGQARSLPWLIVVVVVVVILQTLRVDGIVSLEDTFQTSYIVQNSPSSLGTIDEGFQGKDAGAEMTLG